MLFILKTCFMQQGNLQGDEKVKKTANDPNRQREKELTKNDSDTAPDEFIAPNADTDQPLDDKGIVNDAVLGGEDHQNIDFEEKQEKKKQ
jgi:hypothetical protein